MIDEWGLTTDWSTTKGSIFVAWKKYCFTKKSEEKRVKHEDSENIYFDRFECSKKYCFKLGNFMDYFGVINYQEYWKYHI